MNSKAGLSVHKCVWRFVNQIKDFSRTESQGKGPGPGPELQGQGPARKDKDKNLKLVLKRPEGLALTSLVADAFWCIKSPSNVSCGCKCRPISAK